MGLSHGPHTHILQQIVWVKRCIQLKVSSDTALLDNLEEEKQADKSDTVELNSVGEEMNPVKSDTNISSVDDGCPSTGQPNMKTSQRISFEEFVRSNKLTKIYKMRPKKLFKKIKKRVEEVNEYFTFLNRKDKVDFKLSLPILTYSGRRPARGFLQCIIKNHREKKSWNGSFDISDMEIDNGHFIISKEPVFQLTADNASEDFKRFFQLILVPYYKNASLNIYPLYFKEFAEDILKIPDPNVDFDDFLKFEKYLLLHLAFMPPFSRASLLKDVYKVYESIHYKDLHQPRLNKYINRDWREYVKVVPIFSNVYYHGVTAFSDPYTCTYYHLLKYSRHFATHDTDHIKILDTEVQLLSDMIVTDLALGQLICGYLADLVLYVVRDTNMEGRFLRAFHAFEASDGEVFLCAEDDADDESGDSSGD